MILCCTTCGNSFPSDVIDTKCTYCMNDTEVLISDEELENSDPNEITAISEILKEKYKSENSPRYDKDLWEIREQKNTTDSLNKEQKELSERISNHKLTTGYQFDGYSVTKYLGVVSGNAVLGTGMFTEIAGSFSDLFGSSSSPFESKMEKAKEMAIEKLILKSAECGGNALIGIDFDFLTLGDNMIAVSANGTSVVIENKPS